MGFRQCAQKDLQDIKSVQKIHSHGKKVGGGSRRRHERNIWNLLWILSTDFKLLYTNKLLRILREVTFFLYHPVDRVTSEQNLDCNQLRNGFLSYIVPYQIS